VHKTTAVAPTSRNISRSVRMTGKGIAHGTKRMCRGRRRPCRAGGGLSTDARKADDIASSPQQELKNWIVEDLAHAYSLPWSPTKSGRTALDIKQQPWQKGFFIGGAYAFYRPGQWFILRPELREPFQRVFFCWGTYCRLARLMEGAVVTGKAAAAVLRY